MKTTLRVTVSSADPRPDFRSTLSLIADRVEDGYTSGFDDDDDTTSYVFTVTVAP